MREILSKTVFGAELDPADGPLAKKRLVIIVAVMLVVGAAAIFFIQGYIADMDTWKATITGVPTKGRLVNFTFREGSGDIDVASYPEGMTIKEGDRVVVRTDQKRGNLVVRVLPR